MHPAFSPRIQVVLAALLLSSGGVAIKACAFTGWQVASFRAGAAALALVLLRPEVLKEITLKTLAVGLAYGAAAITFVVANKLTTSANAIFIQSSAPLYICLLGPLLLGEAIRRRDLWLMAAMASGLSLFFLGETQASLSAPEPLKGNLVAAFSGLVWGLSILGIRWLSRDGGSGLAAVACGCVMACLGTLPLALPLEGGAPLDWSIVIYLGVVTMAIVFILVSEATRHLNALETGLLLLVEPVLNPLWSWLVLGERPGGFALGGGALILGATLVNAWGAGRGERCRLPGKAGAP